MHIVSKDISWKNNTSKCLTSSKMCNRGKHNWETFYSKRYKSGQRWNSLFPG